MQNNMKLNVKGLHSKSGSFLTNILEEGIIFYRNIFLSFSSNTRDLPNFINAKHKSIKYKLLLSILHAKLLTNWCNTDYVFQDCPLYLSILIDSSYKHPYKQLNGVKRVFYKHILRFIYAMILLLWPFIAFIMTILWYLKTSCHQLLYFNNRKQDRCVYFVTIYTWLIYHLMSLFEYRKLHYKGHLTVFEILDVVLQCHLNHASFTSRDSNCNGIITTDKLKARFFVTDYLLRIYQTWIVNEYTFLKKEYKIEFKDTFYKKCFENDIPIVDTFGLHFDKIESGIEYIVKPNGGFGGEGVFFTQLKTNQEKISKNINNENKDIDSNLTRKKALYANIMDEIRSDALLYRDYTLALFSKSENLDCIKHKQRQVYDNYDIDDIDINYIDSHFMIQKRIYDYHGLNNLRAEGHKTQYISMFRMYTRCNYNYSYNSSWNDNDRCKYNLKNNNNNSHTYNVINNTHLRFDYDDIYVVSSNKLRLSIYLYIDCRTNDLIAFYPSKRVFKSLNAPFSRSKIDLINKNNVNLSKLCDIDMKQLCNVVCNAHKCVAPNIPVLSWDVAIDRNKNIKIIEANITYGYNIQEQLTFSGQDSEYVHFYAYASAIDYFKHISMHSN